MEKGRTYRPLPAALFALAVLLALAGCSRRLSTRLPAPHGEPRQAVAASLSPNGQGQDGAILPDPLRHYRAALAEARAMLDGSVPLSFKRLVFLTENAYLDGRMDYRLFNKVIATNVGLCEMIAVSQDSAYRSDPEFARSWAVWQYLKDTTFLLRDTTLFVKLPDQYDFTDPNGTEEWASTFVMRTLVDGRGNCRSLPYIYKILHDEMGLNTHLALAPNHIFITQRAGRDGVWFNLELTNGSFPSAGWIMSSGYITLDAVRSRLYMAALSDTEAVAQVLVDLAQGAERRFGDIVRTADFQMECLRLALEAHPKNPNARLMLSEQFLTRGDTTETEQIAVGLVGDGYRYAPDLMYAQWQYEIRNNATAAYDTTSYSNIFPERWDSLYNVPIRNAWGGRFDECPRCQTEVRVGDVIVNSETRAVSYPCFNVELQRLSAAFSSRWLSIDPLAAKYPYMSPYAAFANNPILFIDSNGEEIFLPSNNQTNNQAYVDELRRITGLNVQVEETSSGPRLRIADSPETIRSVMANLQGDARVIASLLEYNAQDRGGRDIRYGSISSTDDFVGDDYRTTALDADAFNLGDVTTRLLAHHLIEQDMLAQRGYNYIADHKKAIRSELQQFISEYNIDYPGGLTLDFGLENEGLKSYAGVVEGETEPAEIVLARNRNNAVVGFFSITVQRDSDNNLTGFVYTYASKVRGGDQGDYANGYQEQHRKTISAQ